MRGAVTGLAAVVLCAGACSDSGLPRCSDAAPPDACLVVTQEIVEEVAAYPEGFVSFLRIESAAGDLWEEELEGRSLDAPRVLGVALEPGTYTLMSFQRSCPPSSCEGSEPEPSERDLCTGTITLVANEHRDVNVGLRPGVGCVLSVAR